MVTLEERCADFLCASDPRQKTRSLPVGAAFDGGTPLSIAQLESFVPGRGEALTVVERAERIPRPAALREVSARVKLLHVFLHHEIQAAELSAWAVLRFPGTPEPFRRGLLRIQNDEARHAGMYLKRIEELGGSYGDHAVRDWFWERARSVRAPEEYVALMGLGFEGANLEHAERFEGQLRAVGDAASADLVGQVGREEVAHVRFAAHWFCVLTGAEPGAGPEFDAWAKALPAPLTPSVLRGIPLARERRARAGLSDEFLDRLERTESATARSPRS